MERIDVIDYLGKEYSVGYNLVESGCDAIFQDFDISLLTSKNKGKIRNFPFAKRNDWSIEFVLRIDHLSEGTIIKKIVDNTTKRGFSVGIVKTENAYRLYCELNGDVTQEVSVNEKVVLPKSIQAVTTSDGTSVMSQEVLAENKDYHIVLLFSPNCYDGYTRNYNNMFKQPIVRMYINGREQGVDMLLAEYHYYTALTNDCKNTEDIIVGGNIDALISKLVIYNGIIANDYIYQEAVNIAYKSVPNMPKIIESSQSYNLILDVDNDGDPDDFGDVACSLVLHRRKELNLLGFIVSAHRVANANSVQAIQDYYGYDFPVGLYKGSKCELYPTNTVTENMAIKFGVSYVDDDYENDLLKYRNYLYNAEDNSVVIVTTGSLTSIERLMKSGENGLIDPDDAAYVSSDTADNLGVTGMELIKRKVVALLAVGDVYPSPLRGGCLENNVRIDFTAWKYVTQNFPNDIVFSGGEMGTFVWDIPNAVSPDDSETNPVLWGYLNGMSGGARGAWAHILIALAARGIRDMFICSMPFNCIFNNEEKSLPVKYNAYGKRWFVRFAKGFCNTSEVKEEVTSLISERV